MRAGEDRAVRAEHDRADRYVTGGRGRVGLGESEPHGGPPGIPYGIGSVIAYGITHAIVIAYGFGFGFGCGRRIGCGYGVRH
ncbi:hypothetical protein GCM10017674_43050 [Streptomyces gardneri]|uniref:Uncharacterized protein n=1 Tax=Streptomyces gardneri TaxID=66892 RepID=A0A4Y3RSM2_9ACTN|nr:hypothetical protein SGA01_54320 [Streptomyces gardneri]GHH04601.1 hypothetical protein GCM10017674_43050 [Streptomyces gardneri]